MAGPTVRASLSPAAAALGLLDEAVHRLRRQPGLLLFHALGAMPFGLGLLYFWSDMSRSAFASERCALEALGLALLYVWMKTWHARFMSGLYADAAGVAAEAWSVRRFLRAAGQQAMLQSTAAPVLLLVSIPVLPSAWCIAFYENAVLYGNGERRTLREVVGLSWTQARFQPLQNHVLLSVLSLFTLVVFAELFWGMVFLPELLRLFTGTETVFTRSGLSLLNSTLFAVTGVTCYVVVDPLLKAAYVLRCFRGRTERTGEDLLLGLRLARAYGSRSVRRPLPCLVLLLGLALAVPGLAAPAATAPDAAPPQALADAIRSTLSHPRYSWRMPRTRLPTDREDEGAIGRLTRQVREWLHAALTRVRDWLQDAWRWLRRLLFDPALQHEPDGRPTGSTWQELAPYLVVGITAVVLAGLALSAWRAWKRRGSAAASVVDAVAMAAVDPADENVTADRLPPEDWLQAARDLIARGELRLGLRAAYLASLALLARRNLISIARHKSNLDYRRELARRATQLPAVVRAFDGNVGLFDRVWYGTCPVSPDLVDGFLAEVDRLRDDIEP